jgi:hypothetical protein
MYAGGLKINVQQPSTGSKPVKARGWQPLGERV